MIVRNRIWEEFNDSNSLQTRKACKSKQLNRNLLLYSKL